MKQRYLALLCLITVCTHLLAACGQTPAQPQGPTAAEQSSSGVLDWYSLLPELIMNSPGWTPPVVARALGYIGVSAYEAVVPGMPEYQSLAGQLNGLASLPAINPEASYDWPTAANAALATIITHLFQTAPTEVQASISALADQQAQAAQTSLEPAVYDRSATWGQAIGLAIYIWSMEDGGYRAEQNNFPDTYELITGDGLWSATHDTFPYPLQPRWGHNRPFVLKNGAECLPPAPPTYSTEPGSPFYNEAHAVYTAVRNLSEEQREIALFWADDPGLSSTPPGHSASILTQILRNRQAPLSDAVILYAQLGMAVADAFISGWYAKYHYNLVRPITYIHEHIDPNWRTIVATPPFPEYPSGHSVQAGAATTILTSHLGSTAFTDFTHNARGIEARSFTSFDAMAQEAAISRLYGGIHYQFAIDHGLDQGRCVGKQVLELAYKP